MADLLTAATVQIGYAAKTKGLERLGHIVKAQGYLGRVAVPLAPAPIQPDEPAVDEPLSPDFRIALAQILAACGFDVSVTNDPVAVVAKASPDQNRELALIGFFGQPGNPGTPGVDWSLFERYYQDDGQGNWSPIGAAASDGAWRTYVLGIR